MWMFFCVILDCRWWKPTTCATKGISWPKNKGLGSILCDMSMSQLVLSNPTEGDMGKSRKVLPTRPFGTSTPVSSPPSLLPPKEMFIIPHRSLPSPLNKSQASEQDKATNCTKQPQKLTHSKSNGFHLRFEPQFWEGNSLCFLISFIFDVDETR